MESLPYLQDPVRITEKLLGVAPPLGEVLSEEETLRAAAAIVRTAVEKGALEAPQGPLPFRVQAVHAAIALAGNSGSPRIVRSLLDAVYMHALRALSRLDPSRLPGVARLLGLDLEESSLSIPWLVDPQGRTIPLRLPFSIRLAPYLGIAARSGSPELALSNAFVRDGRVYLDRSRTVLLLASAARIHVERLMEKYRHLDAPRIREEAMKLALELDAPRGAGLRFDLLPECISRLAREGAESDRQAYVIVSFLAALKPPRQDIERLLLQTRLATPAALDNLSAAILGLRRAYTPYKCGTPEMEEACGKCSQGLVQEYLEAARPSRGSRRGRGRG